MTILSMCIDQERGRYMAVFAEKPHIKAFSGLSESDAIGELVRSWVSPTMDLTINEIHSGVDGQ